MTVSRRTFVIVLVAALCLANVSRRALRTRLGREVAAEVREYLGTHVFEAVIPRNVRLSEAPSFGLPISRYDATCAGCDAYFDLAKEVVSRG